MEGLITTIKEKEKPNGRVVYLMRHGETILNAENKIRGWADVPLTEEGLQQAADLGAAIRDDGIEMDGIYSSDLLRTLQTSHQISIQTGIPILGTSRSLRPWDVGEYTGKDGDLAHKVMEDYARNKPFEDIPGGESFEIFKNRFLIGMIGFLNSNRGLKLGLTSHSRGERIVHAWVVNGCPADLEVDMDEFLSLGEGTATLQELVIECPLIFS